MMRTYDQNTRRLRTGALLSLAVLLLLGGCGNIFQVGLGDDVDLDIPTISLTSNQPGSYLKGSVTLSGAASDDQELTNVEVSFDGGTTWNEASYAAAAKNWSYVYDTTSRSDGRLRLMVRGTDNSGKIGSTDELVFNIDNTPPVLLVTGPRDYETRDFNTIVTLDVAASDIHPLDFFRVEVLDESGASLGEPVRVDQSASPWTFSFRSADYYPAGHDPDSASEPYRFTFRIAAQDDSGNLSTFFFHTDDVRTANGNQPLTADQIAAVVYPNSMENARSIASSVTVSRDALLGIALDEESPLYLDFDENLDKPVISLTQPNFKADPPHTVAMNGVITGSVRDDDAIAVGYPKLKLWADTDADNPRLNEPSTWTELRDGDTSTPSIFDFEVDLPQDAAGKYRLSIIAQDVNGVESKYEALSLIIASGAPKLSVDTPDNGDFVAGDLVIAGTSTHEAGAPTIDLSFDDGVTYVPAYTTTANASDQWAFATIDTTDPDIFAVDGSYTLRVRATSPGGVQNSESLSITVDNTAPSLQFTSPANGASVNGVFTLRGTSDDNIQVKQVDYRYPDSNSTWTEFTSGGDSQIYSWDTQIDSTTLGDGPLQIQVRVTDRALNETIGTLDVTVAESGDNPVITLSNVDTTDGHTYGDNVFTGQAELQGTVSDDDWVNSSSIQVRSRYRATEIVAFGTWSGWAPVSSVSGNAQSVGFNHAFLTTNEGQYEFQLQATDSNEGDRKLGEAVVTSYLQVGPNEGIKFTLDSAPPTLTADGVAGGIQQGGVIVTRQDLTVSGGASDTIGVAAIQYRAIAAGDTDLSDDPWLDATPTPALGAGVTSATYTLIVPVGGAGLTDGEYTLELRAVDAASKQVVTSRQVVVDTEVPSASLDAPAAGLTLNGTVTVRGTSDDTTQVAQTYYQILPTGSSPTQLPSVLSNGTDQPNGWTPFASAYGWSVSWDTYAEQDPTFSSEGYGIYVVSRDTAGNTSVPDVDSLVPVTVWVDQETDRPVFSFTNVTVGGTGKPATPGTQPDNLLAGGTAAITGTLADDDEIDGDTIEFRINAYDWDTDTFAGYGGWQNLTSVAGSSTFSAPTGQGTFSLSIANAVGEGVYAIQFRAADTAFGGIYTDPTDFSWSETAEIEFAYDGTLPSVSVATPVNGSAHRAAFEIAGASSDANGVHSVEIDDGSGLAGATTFDDATGAWTFTAPVAGDGTTDGSVDYVVRVTDRLGRTRETTRTFIRDATSPFPPTITPVAGEYQVNSLVASGTATDAGSGLQTVRYSFDDATFTDATGTTNWFLSADIGASGASLSEGMNTLYLRAVDRAGNESVSASAEFTVDRTNPSLAVTGGNTVPGTTYLNGDVTLSGTVGDVNGVDAVTINYTIDGVAQSQLLNDTDGDGVWAHTLTPGSDGEYVFTITATDGVGRETAVTRTVRVDTAAPSAEVTSLSPVVGTNTVNGKITIRALIADLIALGSTEWALLPAGTSPLAANYAAVASGSITAPEFAIDTTTGTGNVVVNGATGSPFSRAIADDSDSTFWLRATDRAGNTIVVAQDLAVDQDSDAPQISFATINETADTPAESSANLIESNALVRFTVTDDDLVDGASMDISVGDALSWGPVNHDGAGDPADARSITTSHNLYSPTVLPEGTTSFYLRASDDASAKDGIAATERQIGPIYLMVDRNFPTLTETSLGGDVFRSALFPLSGSVGDTNALTSLTVTESVDGGGPIERLNDALTGSSDTWELPNMPFAGVVDGVYEYVITVTDASGKQTVLTRTVTIDTTAPALPVVTDPVADEWLGASTHVFSGTSNDGAGSGVASVHWYEASRGSALPPVGDAAWTDVTPAPDGSWSATVTVGGSGLRDFSVYVVDEAGNPSPVATRSFGLDLVAPGITVDGGTGTAYVNGNFTISGDYTDISGLQFVGVETSANNTTFAPADPATATVDAGTLSWSWDRIIGTQTDGTYYYRFTFTDLAGNTTTLTKTVNLDTGAPGIAFTSATPSINFDGIANTADANDGMELAGSVTEDQGTANLQQIDYRIDEGLWTSLPIDGTFAIGGIDTTTTSNGSPLWIDVRARDRNGNEATERFTFAVDQATDVPVVTISAPANNDTVSTVSITVSGTTTDDDGIDDSADSIEYRFSEDGGSTFGSWTSIDPFGTVTAVSRSFAFTLSAGSDGAKVVQFRATDIAGVPSGVTTLNLSFDTAEPEIVLTGPTEDSYVNGDFAVTGTVSDTSGTVDSLEYRVRRDGGAYGPYSYVLGPGLGSTSSPFSQTIDTSAGTGEYEVELRASDGSFVRTTSVSLFVDRSVPTVAFTGPATGSTQNNIITVNGTAGDTYGVASVDVGVWDGSTLQPLPTGTLVGVNAWSVADLDTRNGTLLSYATDLTGGVYELTLRATVTDVGGNITTTTTGTDLVFQIDQTTDRPIITFDEIVTDGSSTVQSGTIRGTVTDDDGVAAIEVDVYQVNDTIVSETVTLTSGSYGQTDVGWRVDLDSVENGVREIVVRATDTVDNDANSRTDTGRIEFQLDTENPDAGILTPAPNGTWSSNNTFTVTGNAADETGVTALAYKIDDNDFSLDAVPVADTNINGWTTWTFTIPQGDLADGAHTVYVEATDSVGRTRIASRSISVDKAAPTINVTSPASGTAVFGPLTIGGTTADNVGGAGVAQVSIGLGRQINPLDLEGSTWTAVPGTTSWSFSFLNINDYANTTYSHNTGDTDQDGIEDAGETWTDIWDFTFYVRAEDDAGIGAAPNVGYLTSYTLQIDPKRDRPEVSIFSPSDGATVGGFVRVFGSAFDSQFVEKVQVAIDANNDGDYSNDTWSEAAPDETDADGVEWYLASGTTSWSVNLNEAGEFDPTGGDSTRTISFKVRAKDYKVTPGDGIYGADVEYDVTFNKDFPRFGTFSITSGETVGGTKDLIGIVRDETDVQRIIFSNEGPLLDNTIIFTNPGNLTVGAANQVVSSAAAISAGIAVELLGTSDPDYDVAFPGSYRVTIPIDTEAPGLYPNGAGSMSVRVTAEDTTTPSPFTNQQLISFNVDNVVPTDLAYTGDGEIVGTDAELRGTVRDTGTVSGIDRIIVYLTNAAGEIVRLQNGPGTIGGFLEADVLNELNATYADYRMVIDNRLEDGVDGSGAGDRDGIPEFLTLSAGVYQWGGIFDSTVPADGAVTVHAIAEDFAGNSASITSAAFIANNRPAIDSIVLGTDLNGDTDVIDAGEQGSPITTGFATTGFTARNNLLYVGINASGGNGTLLYSVWYDFNGDTVFDAGEELSVTLTNSTVTIDTSTVPESTAVNDRSFVIRVYDSTTSDDADATDELTDVITVNLTVDNVDDVSPSIGVAPFGQRYNDTDNDDLKSLGPVGSYEDNVAMNGSQRLGHVEYAADSAHDGADADLSGQVIFKGKVEDNQNIRRITATIPGYNGGADFDIYNATLGGSQSGADWSFSVDGTNYLTESNGNVLNWDFQFNTAAIAGTTANGVIVTFTTYDFNPTANGGLGNSGASSIQVDVVPYIAGIERDPNTFSTDRSKRGAYPLQQDETGIVIHGFNLLESTVQDANNWVRIYNATGTLSETVTVMAADATKDRLTVALSGLTASGYLRISVNSIQDINRVNNDALEYNREDDGSGIASTIWTDNRYVSLWAVGDVFPGSQDPQHPSMDIRQSNGRIYGGWSNYASSAAYYARPASQSAAITTLFQTYDPPEWTDIAVESGADTVHSTILQNYYGGTGTTAWGRLVTQINAAGEVILDDMGDDAINTGIDHSDGYDEQLYQFQNPRIVISDEGTNRHYVAYYDAWARAVKYSVATNGVQTFTTAFANITNQATVVDGEDDFDDDPSDSGDDVGQYLDIQMDPDDSVPVIIYYDTTNKTLKIARGQNAIPNGRAQWNTAFVLPANSFSGQYVSMKVDRDPASPTYGDLFVSYYKVSTGDLMFIHAGDVDGTGAGVQYTFGQPVAVDTEGAVGAWTDLYLVDGRPVVSYLNSTQIGTFAGLKLARYTGDGTSWEDGSDWEHEIIPASDAVSNKRTNVVGLDAGDAVDWNAAVGYASANFNIVYRKLEQ